MAATASLYIGWPRLLPRHWLCSRTCWKPCYQNSTMPASPPMSRLRQFSTASCQHSIPPIDGALAISPIGLITSRDLFTVQADWLCHSWFHASGHWFLYATTVASHRWYRNSMPHATPDKLNSRGATRKIYIHFEDSYAFRYFGHMQMSVGRYYQAYYHSAGWRHAGNSAIST
jgi:hypothetical protein